MPQGLQAPPEKSTAVTFHAIVPLLFWEWEDANSHMHIRFDRFALGQWRYNCGKMTKQRLVPYLHCAKGLCWESLLSLCRAIGDGWYEMTCTLSIDAEILKHPVAYKYVVYSPKMENKDDCYEYLHGYGGNPNRCLRIPKSKLSKTYGGNCVFLLHVINLQHLLSLSVSFMFQVHITSMTRWYIQRKPRFRNHFSKASRKLE